MRVLSLTTIYPNDHNAAEGRSVAFLDRALAELGIAGTTLVLRPYAPQWLARRVGKWKHLAVRERLDECDGACVLFARYLHLSTRYSLTQCVASMTARAVALIEKHQLEFDLVHGQSIYPAALAAQRVAARYRVPFVVTLRDDFAHLENLYKRRPGARALFAPMFAETAAVFVHGPGLYRDAPKFLPPGLATPVILAPNGVDVSSLETQLVMLPPPAPHAWGEIISIGTLIRIKGIHENLRALQELDARGLRTWHYTIVGDGPYRQALETLSAELGLLERVTFTGRLPHQLALQRLQNSDILSLPSWAEAFGNVYAEAAVCERPAVGCRDNGAELIIRDGETGLLVPPRDVTALADALAFLLTHPAEAQAMGMRAREHVRQLTWERTAQLYADAFAHIVKVQT